MTTQAPVKMVEVDVWVVVDHDGDYRVAMDADQAHETFETEVGGSGARRLVCVTLSLPAPRAVEVCVTLPAESEVCAVKVG